MRADRIVVFCDGAAKGNPGPGGWGVVIATAEGHVTELGGAAEHTTNNKMELTAAIHALTATRDTGQAVDVHTDSTYVIKGITEWIWGWRRRGWKTADGTDVLNRDLWMELDRLAELEVLTPDDDGYSPSDVRIVEAISRFRAGGYEERIGFTVYDTLRYKQSMADLVRQEVDVLMERLAGEMDPDEAMGLIEAGTQPLNDLIAAMNTKALVAELERRRGSGQDGSGASGRD